MTPELRTSPGTTVELQVAIAAPPERVWDALVLETSDWWPRDFFTDQRAMSMVCEPRLGGRLYEDWDGGRGRTWYTILTFDPPHVLEMAGHLFPAFGGPAETMLRLELEEKDSGTVLKLSDSIMGRADSSTRASIHGGWRAIFADAFRAHVERVIRS